MRALIICSSPLLLASLQAGGISKRAVSHVTCVKLLHQFSIHHLNIKDIGFPMLFHNRPVRAAMGSVIANGGVQLSNDESLIRAE